MTKLQSQKADGFAVIGMGVQGKKRRRIIGDQSCITVDPIAPDVDYRNIQDVPTGTYQTVFLCTPDSVKFEIVEYLLAIGKHVLIEKPFTVEAGQYEKLTEIQAKSKSTLYVAYNHRFEPHIAKLNSILKSGQLGEIYTVSLSYGNGTAELVRQSEWRDTGIGVLSDLGSHLLDMIDFWWGLKGREIDFLDARTVENRSFDHANFRVSGSPIVYAETSLLSWRNDFHCDIRGSAGSARISSLCKWGPSSLTVRGRVHPSGRPDECTTTLIEADPTWSTEHDHFLRLIEIGDLGNLETSREIARVLAAVTLK
jgi:scyllo-inositol 2-dehydrogenase (NADP+)